MWNLHHIAIWKQCQKAEHVITKFVLRYYELTQNVVYIESILKGRLGERDAGSYALVRVI